MHQPEQCLTLRQTSLYRWELINPRGTVLLSDIYLPHVHSADTWMRCYVSSWPTYTYKIEPKEFNSEK